MFLDFQQDTPANMPDIIVDAFACPDLRCFLVIAESPQVDSTFTRTLQDFCCCENFNSVSESLNYPLAILQLFQHTVSIVHIIMSRSVHVTKIPNYLTSSWNFFLFPFFTYFYLVLPNNSSFLHSRHFSVLLYIKTFISVLLLLSHKLLLYSLFLFLYSL